MLRRLWLVGCGNMGGAMLRQWLASGTIAAGDVSVINRADRDLPTGVWQGRSAPAGAPPDAVMLAMKPQQLDAVGAALGRGLGGAPMLISILAGVEEAALRRRFDVPVVVRAMPNLPVGIGKGVVALHMTDRWAPQARAQAGAVASLMAPLGLVEWIDDAASFDLVTALAGSGPAFLYRFIDALARAAGELGLAPDQSARLALATVEGAALLAAAAAEPPAVLADRVASPGGSTREGLNVLDDGAALEQLLRATLAAATRRNAELAAAAR